MVNHESFVGGMVGTVISAMSIDVSNLRSIESIIAIVCTIAGFTITFISSVAIPFIKWLIKAKKDGKIAPDEMVEGAETLRDGLQDLKDKLEENNNKEDHK